MSWKICLNDLRPSISSEFKSCFDRLVFYPLGMHKISNSRTLALIKSTNSDTLNLKQQSNFEASVKISRQINCKELILRYYSNIIGAKRVTRNCQMIVQPVEFADIVLCPYFHNSIFVQYFQSTWKNQHYVHYITLKKKNYVVCKHHKQVNIFEVFIF